MAGQPAILDCGIWVEGQKQRHRAEAARYLRGTWFAKEALELFDKYKVWSPAGLQITEDSLKLEEIQFELNQMFAGIRQFPEFLAWKPS